jgi:hypothetical protein
MESNGPLDALPLWGVFADPCSCSAFCRVRLPPGEISTQPTRAGKGDTCWRYGRGHAWLLAFILAFTFGLAAARFDTRRQVLLDEANAIGTTYLRAGMLPDRRDGIQALLREYVDTRLEALRSGNIAARVRQSENIQSQLWAHATAVGEKNPNSIVVGLFIQSLNDVIDLHAKRVQAGLRSRIPGAIWVGLFAVAALSLATMGYHAGMVGTRRSLAILAVAFTFSVVIELIADLDRPQEGILKVSQQALLDLQRSMNGPTS